MAAQHRLAKVAGDLLLERQRSGRIDREGAPDGWRGAFAHGLKVD